MANDLMRGRQVVVSLTNKTGGQVVAGDVVIISSADAASFIANTSAAQTNDSIGVVAETIAIDAIGRVIFEGYTPIITLASAASLGDFVNTHSVAKQAVPTGTLAAGVFGQVLGTGTTPAAFIWGKPNTAAATGGVGSDIIWDAKGDLAVGTGANAAAKLTVGSNGKLLSAASGEATGLEWISNTHVLTLGLGGTLSQAAGTMRLYVPWACTITNVRVTVGTAPTGASIVVDLNINGTTAFSTQGNRPTITAGNFTDLASTPDIVAIAADDYLTIDLDAVGSVVAGSDLVVQVEVTIP